ncbi:MAG TPA: FAD-dependent oxidoreductase [Solirubrobacterales bacterium]|nr:FAD-dependent oxidoreductase [Solirubrobacterales bacterium]
MGATPSANSSAAEAVIAGGGIAGLEALLALHDLAGDRADLTLVSAEPDFTYRPLTVTEPFEPTPAPRHDLAAICDDLGAAFVCARLEAVDPKAGELDLGAGRLRYDKAVIATGAPSRNPFRGAELLVGPGRHPSVDELIVRAARHPSRRIAFIVPAGASWPLPAYELALLCARRAGALRHELETVIVTPEAGPLIMFGAVPSRHVYELLRARGVSFLPATYAREQADGEIVLAPGEGRLDAGAIVSLPLLVGPAIEGLPSDRDGFIPIDPHARVVGTNSLFAAGDGTTFPIKQGGIASQQADAAAAQIAADLGAEVDPAPFHPVLRGKLIVGEESLHLRADAAGGAGEGTASADYLWWPPHKVAARYLSRYLADEEDVGEPDLSAHPIDVEVALPTEWHREPMALDPYASLGR